MGCHLWGRTESDTTEATWQQHPPSQLVFHFNYLILSPTIFFFYKNKSSYIKYIFTLFLFLKNVRFTFPLKMYMPFPKLCFSIEVDEKYYILGKS